MYELLEFGSRGILLGVTYGLLAFPISLLFIATDTVDLAVGGYAVLAGAVAMFVGESHGAALGITMGIPFRMTWLVFFGAERESLHAHDAGNAMKIALAILAIGTFTTWLFFGGFSKLLSSSLPFHGLHEESTLHVVEALLSAPATWFALLIVAASLTLFFTLGRKFALSKNPPWLNALTETSFGFESINDWVVRGVSVIAEKLRFTQSGEMNWNILGIMGGLLLVLLVLLWSGV